MCVIMWANKTRPTQRMVEKAYELNDDGAGIAYRKVNDQGQPVVYWKKGLNVGQMAELCANAPLPYIAHFRIASIGGVSPGLTHPFPIDRSGSLSLEGETSGYVLFHNGHWKDWNDHCLRAAGARDVEGRLVQVPWGRWSDTRAMAWLCSIYGPGYMNFLPEQKGVIFGPRDMQIFDGNGWEKIEVNGKDEFVWCSNNAFMKGERLSGQQTVHQPGHQTYPTPSQGQTQTQTPGRGAGPNGRFCKYDQCHNTTLDTDGWCYLHPKGVDRMNPRPVVMGPKATGGSRVPPSPFVQRLPLELKSGEVISIELAEHLHKEKILSHNKLKKIRGLWEKATGPGKKASNRAQQALRQMSVKILNTQ